MSKKFPALSNEIETTSLRQVPEAEVRNHILSNSLKLDDPINSSDVFPHENFIFPLDSKRCINLQFKICFEKSLQSPNLQG